MEKKKKKKTPFNKIDITTATDDDIIRSGLRHNTTKDIICYFIMFVIFVLAILPVVFRIAMPRKKTIIETDIVYYKLTCFKTIVRDEHELSTALTSNYRDGIITDITFDFNFFKRSEDAVDGYTFSEVYDFEQLNVEGKTSKIEKDKASFTFDYEKNPKLKDHPKLKDYSYFSATELSYLDSQGYSCSSKTETKLEVIDIETRKKVK